jgi:hypothetical protein
VGLRLGIDFGTATTCVATVRNHTTFAPVVIPLDGSASFADSVVWVHATDKPLVTSASKYERAPHAVFHQAKLEFKAFWAERVKAQADGVQWARWRDARRERSMLLSYFKPELADKHEPQYEDVIVTKMVWDPMSQSEDVYDYYQRREIADPRPDTDDLVAATAALLKNVVGTAVDRYGESVERIAVGVPSFADQSSDGEAHHACERRREALRMAGLGDVHVDFVGEAQAAGFGLDVASDVNEAFAIVVDVGAGTTDLALVPYARGKSGRLEPGNPLLHGSIRFAGRDINAAIAGALPNVNPRIRRVYDAMDMRSWQLLVDEDVEELKRSLRHESMRHTIQVNRYAAHHEGCLLDEERRGALYCWVPLDDISLQHGAIRASVQDACKAWREQVVRFLSDAREVLGSKSRRLAGIEMVGGAFKFDPLQRALTAAVRSAGWEGVPVRFRNQGDECQTVVARGLARWLALQA